MIRSRAPLRVSFAGGGTDLDTYARQFGGTVLNATIDLAAHVTLTPRSDGHIGLRALDQCRHREFPAADHIDISTWGADDQRAFQLAIGVYHHVIHRHRNGAPLAFDITTAVDAPPGSGLGSSSTLVVALLAAFDRWLRWGLDAYAIAEAAVQIERGDLGLAGGRQDQYAAAFGGWNQLVFRPDGQVVVHPLRIPHESLMELESIVLLYDTGRSRSSSQVIEGQLAALSDTTAQAVDHMHALKTHATAMTEAILTGRLDQVGPLLEEGWRHKQSTAAGITTSWIDAVHAAARAAGASGAKVSGAGGGGFMILACPGWSRHAVMNALEHLGGSVHRLRFSTQGVTTWISTSRP